VSEPAPHQIRLAQPRDARSVLRLGEATFVPASAQLGAVDWARRIDFAGFAYSGRLWVLELDRKIVGMIYLIGEPARLEIFALAVSPEFQRRGFGRALIEFAEREAHRREVGELCLQTPVQFLEAIAFYQRLGFVEAEQAELEGVRLLRLTKAVTGGATAPRP